MAVYHNFIFAVLVHHRQQVVEFITGIQGLTMAASLKKYIVHHGNVPFAGAPARTELWPPRFPSYHPVCQEGLS